MTARADGTQGAAYTVLATRLGKVTVVREEGALTGLYFPRHWPRPDRTAFGRRADEGWEDVARQLGEYLGGDRRVFELPLMVKGSEFDRRVWELIADVPYGQTTTYGDLARGLGAGTDPRAVGAAVGRNPLCIVIPCHRVIGSTGKLTGYAGGLDRKRTLLEIERARALLAGHAPTAGLQKLAADNIRRERKRPMSIEENKAVVGRWFTEFWGKDFNPAIIDELAAPDIRFEYSLHAPLRGRDAVRAFAGKFRAAFPDLNFWGTADLIAEGDYVVGQWEGGGTHTGDAFDDMPVGSLPANTGKVMRFTGTTVLKVENGLITEEIGLDDGVTALSQLGLIAQA